MSMYTETGDELRELVEQREALIARAWETPCVGCRTPYRIYVREVKRLEAAGKRVGVDDLACCAGGTGRGSSPRFELSAATVLRALGVDPFEPEGQSETGLY